MVKLKSPVGSGSQFDSFSAVFALWLEAELGFEALHGAMVEDEIASTRPEIHG